MVTQASTWVPLSIFLVSLSFNSFYCFPLNPTTKCHFTCEMCDQFDDPNSCTSCFPGQFKSSRNYGSGTFACSKECPTESSIMPARKYKFCQIIISSTTNASLLFNLTTSNYEQDILPNIIAENLHIHITVIYIALSFLLFSMLTFIIYILCKMKAKPPKSNYVQNKELVPLNNNQLNPIKPVVRKNESKLECFSAVYTNLRNVDIKDFTIAKGEPIGGGNFSRVHEGTLDGELIAIKKALKEGRKSIHKELQIYDSIRHPNIVEAKGFHLGIENLLFLPLRRFNLSAYFDGYGSDIDVKQLIEYCIQLTNALKYLHKNNVIHCDLKTDNILVKDNGKEIEITDFGSAVDLKHDHTSPFHHATITHMAYELLKYPSGPTYVGTEETDVWAYGVTVWQIFSKTQFLPAGFIKSKDIIENYETGKKLPKPQDMPERWWRYIFLQCFDLESSARPKMNEVFAKLTKEISQQMPSK